MDVAHGFHVFRDGNAWCAVGPHFVDLMQSDAAFGDTPQKAVENLRIQVSGRRWWQDKVFPSFDRFTIHGEAQRNDVADKLAEALRHLNAAITDDGGFKSPAMRLAAEMGSKALDAYLALGIEGRQMRLPTLKEIHGDDDCHICGKPKAGSGSIHCSYPHGMVPDKAVSPDHPEGFWTWKHPIDSNDEENPAAVIGEKREAE